MQFKDYYKTLSVSRTASQDDIKRAYRRLARKYHPDVSNEPAAEERFKEIGEAYAVLKSPEKRAAYDRLGTNWQQGQEFQRPPQWDSVFEFNRNDNRDGYSDFFASLFGHNEATGFQSHTQDHHAKITISLEDAFHGGQRSISLRQPELAGRGQVAVQERMINITIPKGAIEGQVIRLPARSEGQTGRSADLYLEIQFQAHPLFKANGRNIHLDLPVLPWETALGATVVVPTLGGKVKLKVPPSSRGEDILRLAGRGLPGNPPGDQLVRLRLVTPPADNETIRSLYQQMRAQNTLNPRFRLGV